MLSSMLIFICSTCTATSAQAGMFSATLRDKALAPYVYKALAPYVYKALAPYTPYAALAP